MVAVSSQRELAPVTVTLNGRRTVLDAAPGERLLDVLRRQGFLEVKEGCGEGECGSCTVLLDGRAVCSCLTLTQSVDGAEIVTVASPAHATVAALRQSFVDEMGTQCGFCTPGMVLSAAELLADNPTPEDDAVRVALAGNLCRCTGYTRIVKAVHQAAAQLRAKEQP